MARPTEDLRWAARHLDDLDALLELVGDRRLVLIGEATHGTHEFYAIRVALTRRLIEGHGFSAVAVEADWPDAFRVNRYVRGSDEDARPEQALGGFTRFPTWMWRNADVLTFVTWLRRHNDDLPSERRIGFYGLDLYSLYASVEAVTAYLDKVDPAAARRARQRYGCFQHVAREPQAYGFAAATGESCEDEVVEQLAELRRRAAEYAGRDGRVAEDELFHAEQNARLVVGAERYYRTMFRGGASSWNLRDTHMADTLDALVRHLRDRTDHPKVVVWEHNSHIGDARATEMGWAGELNVGQLARERHGEEDVALVGFTTHDGTVTAASDWDLPPRRRDIVPALAESYEHLFHDTELGDFWLPLGPGIPPADALDEPRLERAIGVVYRPESERASHWFRSHLPTQFDAVIHVDRSTAVVPLDPLEAGQEPPETYPTAM